MPARRGEGEKEFQSMEPYLEPGPFEALASSMYRSRLLRKRIWEMPRTSAYRRTSVMKFFAWCYRRFTDGRGIPYAVFAPEFKMQQSAAIIDTAGTFTGPDGMDLVYEEMSAAFGEFNFTPEHVIELDDERIMFMVRFE